jgi:hypothetical protein
LAILLKNKLFIFLICLFLGKDQFLFAQRRLADFQSFATWLEITASQKLKENWSTQLDFQYRRRSACSGEKTSMLNPFRLPVQMVFRPWIHSHHVTDWRFSVSPIGYWRNSNVRPNGEITVSHELRSSFQVLFVVGKRAKFSQ